MINNTTLVGRLTKNPELKYTGSGIAVLSFSLAVERNYKNAQGERETDFINCVAWRDTAETLSNFAVRGSLIGITGAIQTRSYQNNEGRTIYITEIVADKFQMLEPKEVTDKRRGNNQQNTTNNQQKQTNKPDDNPFANIGTDDNPFETNDDAESITDDDLPF